MLADAQRKPTPAEAPILIAGSPAEVRDIVASWKRKGDRVALVPTMGALHEGHLMLVAEAQARADRVVVSIFVNPTQFAPTEDLARYPRTFEQDCALLQARRADLVYAPRAEDMYPHGFSTRVNVGGPAGVGLEDASRPHFFSGVATVVAKLLLQTRPDVALFGEKDYQQLCVVRAMVRDLDLAVEIVAVPTVREDDGLALSSRNRYLSEGERQRAVMLHAALQEAAALLRQGRSKELALQAAAAIIARADAELDYLELRDAISLAPVEVWSEARPARLLVAARLGTTRLIDNIAV